MTIKWLYDLKGIFTRKNKRKTKSLSYPEAKTFGIFIKNNDPSTNPFIQKFIKDLENEGKRVETVCFFEKIVNSKYDFSFHTHTKKQTNIWGTPKDSVIEEFQKKPFDFLVFFVDEWNLEILPFLNKTKARVIVGNPDKIPLKYLDLGIKGQNGNLSLIPEIMLENIKKLK